MKVQELIKNLESGHSESIEIRDSDNYTICTTRTDRKGMRPYLDCEIKSWFPFHSLYGGICILIEDDGKEQEHEHID